MNLEDIITPETIIRLLCIRRAKQAHRRHNRSFLDRIAPPHQNDTIANPIDALFPPRRLWLRPNRSQRDNRSGYEVMIQSLERTVYALRESSAHSGSSWVVTLNRVIEEVMDRALSSSGHHFSTPRIEFRIKQDHIYRPIASYNFVDGLIDSLIARYLRRCFDPDMSPSSYAFRSGNSLITHHDAMRAISAFHQSHPSSVKWVAECDIASFFDTIHHQIAQQAISDAEVRCLQRGQRIDQRALRYYAAFLDSYTFTFSVIGWPSRQELVQKDPDGYCAWPVDLLRGFWKDPFTERIGIPQGSALSCLTANLVLDNADRAVLEPDDNRLCYVRYCDDMVIIHPDKKKCRDAFLRYGAALAMCKLPAHPAVEITRYGAGFWTHKTKLPYCWTGQRFPGAVPWVAFVGYHLHYQGFIRVRQSSIEKQLAKQEKICLRVVHRLQGIAAGNRSIRVTARQVNHRVHQRLISMSVGRRKIWSDLEKPAPFCWCDGMRALRWIPFLSSQLRQLDRGREHSLIWLRRTLKKLPMTQKTGRSSGSRPLRYYGHPFSYRGQFPYRSE